MRHVGKQFTVSCLNDIKFLDKASHHTLWSWHRIKKMVCRIYTPQDTHPGTKKSLIQSQTSSTHDLENTILCSHLLDNIWVKMKSSQCSGADTIMMVQSNNSILEIATFSDTWYLIQTLVNLQKYQASLSGHATVCPKNRWLNSLISRWKILLKLNFYIYIFNILTPKVLTLFFRFYTFWWTPAQGAYIIITTFSNPFLPMDTFNTGRWLQRSWH